MKISHFHFFCAKIQILLCIVSKHCIVFILSFLTNTFITRVQKYIIDFTNHLMSSRTDSCYGVSLFATDERDANCWIFAVVLLALLYYPESRN